MSRVIQLLNDFSYAAGIIGLAELQERTQIAFWLFSRDNHRLDPRGKQSESDDDKEKLEEGDVFQRVGKNGAVLGSAAMDQSPDEPAVLQFLALKRWYFTLGDADCAPSVPHGHEDSKSQKWPKLNPYTGKVFTAIHQEDTSRRLSRQEMQLLWRNDDFIDYCRKQIRWYSSEFPHYRFSNARKGLLEFPRW